MPIKCGEMRAYLNFPDLWGQVTIGPAYRVSVGVTELLSNDNQRRSRLNKLAGIGVSQAVKNKTRRKLSCDGGFSKEMLVTVLPSLTGLPPKHQVVGRKPGT